ncbi:MAG: hypothetical protein M1814_003220 [Vezdaea aestivalis]|nr:MAG: hypothetical protein M1814_003220 [Vezdaea aestivalis]
METYDRLQQGLIRYHSGPLRSPDYFLAAGTAGALTSAFTNPIWVLKTRMLSSSSQAPGAYKSMLSGAVSIYRNEGTRGFYRGLAPSLFGTVHGAVQFMIYEKLKKIRASSSGAQRKERTQLSNLDYITLSATAKVVAVILTYPYQVIRARLQTYNADKVYRGARDAVLQTWRLEGMGGFYRGLGPGIVRVLPNVCVTFVVYENTRYYLPGILSN